MSLEFINVERPMFDDTVRDGYFLHDDQLVFFMDYEYNHPQDLNQSYKIYLVKDVFDETVGIYKLTYKPKYPDSRVFVYNTMAKVDDVPLVSERCIELAKPLEELNQSNPSKDVLINISVDREYVKLVYDMLMAIHNAPPNDRGVRVIKTVEIK